ncbi:MAG TPA: LuxR C-terminal-related transcriptional regulator [Symbiobacteriaceae bacterium]|nr:LuxR C-terminal-related transcriptional regulator [Symbiobacteriaceae bacterium]
MPFTAIDTSAWLVQTKLHPPLVRSDTIRRPHLEEELRRSVATLPFTLLSAPAGYGKTTMLATLPHLLPELPLAWITLDAEDNDSVRFVGLLATALQRLHPECGRSAWPFLQGGSVDSAALRRAVGALMGDIMTCLPDPFVLVLDDLHFVTEPAVYVALEFLLDHQPPQMHLAVGTRHDPPLRLARMAARRQLAELRRPDLGFSQAEANLLLNETLGLSLTEGEVTALQERTEGWPAGLCLLAGPLGRMGTRADRTQFMAAIVHTERYALDFLAEEVLRNLPDDLRLFLMRTAILSEMTPSLCRVVTGREDAGDVLEGLYRQNLTIASITTEVEGEPVYRHHALFARLLLRQLERELPGEVVELHRRAAGAQRTPGRAIAHCLAAGLWEEAAQLMASSGMALLHRGMAETVRSWYGALPAEVQASHPRLTTVIGRCEIHRGDYAAAGVLLEQARAAFVAAGDEAGEGEALASLITLTMQSGDPEARAALVERAVQLPLGPLARVAALLGRAWLSYAAGDWAAVRADVAEALSIPRTSGNRQADLIGITYMRAPLAAVPGCMELTEHYCAEAGALALPNTAWRLAAEELGIWVLLWQGRAEEALARAEAAEELRQRLGGYPFAGNDLPTQLYMLYAARGDMAGAEQAMEKLLRRFWTAPRNDRMMHLHAAGRGLTWVGRYAEARGMLQRLTEVPDHLPFKQYFCDHLAGLLALAEGRRADAASALERAAAAEAGLPIAAVAGSARMLLAKWLLDEGRPAEAVAAAGQVLKEWEQAGTPGRALLDGPVAQPVLQLVAAGPGAQGQVPVPVQAPAQAAPPAEPLTPREADVLKLLVAGRTNRQIGEELYITEETVKTHVVRILRKLDVTSRTQAAVRGRELGY